MAKQRSEHSATSKSLLDMLAEQVKYKQQGEWSFNKDSGSEDAMASERFNANVKDNTNDRTMQDVTSQRVKQFLKNRKTKGTKY